MNGLTVSRELVLIAALLLFASASTAAAEERVVMEIEGMTCEICALAIKKSLEGTEGIKTAEVSFKEKKAWLIIDESITDEVLTEAVEKAGPYKGRVRERKPAA